MSTTPPCRVCGKTEEVIQYPTDNPAGAVCPECCDKAEHANGETGHEWECDAWERDRVCLHCGVPRKCTPYAWDD